MLPLICGLARVCLQEFQEGKPAIGLPLSFKWHAIKHPTSFESTGSSLGTKSFGAPQPPNHRLKQQYSYSLQNFLAQPYNPDTDSFDDSLDSPLSFHSSNLSKPLPPHNCQIHTHYQPNHSHSNHVARMHREPTPHGGCGASRHAAGLANFKNLIRVVSRLRSCKYHS